MLLQGASSFDLMIARSACKVLIDLESLGSFFLVEVEFLVVGGSFGGADGKTRPGSKVFSLEIL